MYPNLVVPPHSREKPMDKVGEAEKVINKGYQPKWRHNPHTNNRYPRVS